MSPPSAHKVAILWRGGREARQAATPSNNRYHCIFEELQKLGIEAEPAVYEDDFADEVRAQLLQVDAVLVWANPIHEGKTRERLNEMLRDVASRGPWVSAHPDTILKMGTKEVVFRTRHMGWGTETRLYTSFAEFRETFPAQLRPSAPRVLKQNRGNDGEGVWKIDLLTAHGPEALVRVCQALAGSEPCETPLDAFLASCEPYFSQGGKILDQPFQARLRDGMIRCYVGENRVVGFEHQYPKGLMPPDQMHPTQARARSCTPPMGSVFRRSAVRWTSTGYRS